MIRKIKLNGKDIIINPVNQDNILFNIIIKNTIILPQNDIIYLDIDILDQNNMIQSFDSNDSNDYYIISRIHEINTRIELKIISNTKNDTYIASNSVLCRLIKIK